MRDKNGKLLIGFNLKEFEVESMIALAKLHEEDPKAYEFSQARVERIRKEMPKPSKERAAKVLLVCLSNLPMLASKCRELDDKLNEVFK